MTREETIQVLALLKAAYPNSYKGISKKEGNAIIAVWATQFTNIPVQIVLIAINKLIYKNTFPPAISEVKDKIKNLYYEATSELLSSSDHLSNSEKQKLMDIRKYCYKSNTKPSLISMLTNNKAPMIKSSEDNNE